MNYSNMLINIIALGLRVSKNQIFIRLHNFMPFILKSMSPFYIGL